jgi:iron complex outermembrane receptor protein
MGYIKASHGYRSGGQNFRGANTPESFAPFKPEVVTEYEVGTKTELLDHTLRLNLAVYLDNYSNIQRSVSVPTAAGAPTTVVANAASARIQGFEFEGEWRPVSQLTLNLATGYTDAYYRKFVDAVLGDLTSLPFDVPRWTATGGARYVQPLSLGDVSIQADYRWQSSVNLVPQTLTPTAFVQHSYGLINSRLNLHIDSIDTDVALYGKNLANKVYYSGGEDLQTSLGFGFLVTGQPRVYGIDVTAHFGH